MDFGGDVKSGGLRELRIIIMINNNKTKTEATRTKQEF